MACLAMATALTGCDRDKYHYDPNWERPHCEFTFETEGLYNLNIDYSNMGVETSVFFELYDRNPVTEGEDGTLLKDENLEPIFTGVTQTDGSFSGSVELPTYLKEVYVYTSNFFAQRVIKASLTDGSITAIDGTDMQGHKVARKLRRNAGSTTEEYKSQTEDGSVIPGEAWKTWLGEYDRSTGIVTGFNEPGKAVTTYVTKRVQNSGTYALSQSWGSYYYTNPQTGAKTTVSTFYTSETGNTKATGSKMSGKWYNRVIETTTEGEGTYHPGYDYKGDDLRVLNYQELYNVHASVINADKSCPAAYRSSEDLLVGQEAEIAITLLGGNTCWTSSLGYYWYADGHKPSSYDEIKDRIVMLFPNTEDGHWSNNIKASSERIGVERGTCVQLKYYPNIASGSTEGESLTFPAGMRIGFVLATNAWTNRLSTGQSFINVNKKYRACTSSGLSQNNSGSAYSTPRTAVYKYGDNIIISFEDHTNDENFSDVVFTLKANPVEAFVDVVDITDTEVTKSENKGWYCFEDIWPSEGDYDLNDVVLRCSQSTTWPITKTTTTSTNGVVTSVVYSTPDKIGSEEFCFKTYQNFAAYTDGVSVYVDLPAGVTVDKEEYFIKKPSNTEFEAYKPVNTLHDEQLYNKHGAYAYNAQGTAKVITFTTNVLQDGIGSEYKVKLTYGSASRSTQKTVFRPFICVRNGTIPSGADVPYYEVHLPLETPTNVMPVKYWSTNADASLPATLTPDGKGNFYVRANNMNNMLYGPWYPFAIKFSGATENDMEPLIDRQNEGIAISKLYPNYENWVESNGAAFSNWYKR